MTPDDIRKCFSSMKSDQYALVLEFVSGFGCVPPDLLVIEDDLIHNFHSFHQLCETDSHTVIADSCGSHNVKKVYRTWPPPSPADMWCLGRVIGFSKCKWELSFTFRPLQNEHLKLLCEGINSVDLPNGQIQKLNFSFDNFDAEGLACVLNIEPKCLSSILMFYLIGNRLQSNAIDLLCKKLPVFHGLKVLLLHDNDITLGCHKPLLEAMIQCTKSIEHVSFSNLQEDECQMLLRRLNTLKKVELYQLLPSSIKKLINAIPLRESGSSLEKLEIYQSEITRESISDLPAVLPHSNIKDLVMSNCSIDCGIVEIIVNAGQKHDRLQSIDVSNNLIRDSGGEHLLMLGIKGVNLCNSYKWNYFTHEMQEKVLSFKKMTETLGL